MPLAMISCTVSSHIIDALWVSVMSLRIYNWWSLGDMLAFYVAVCAYAGFCQDSFHLVTAHSCNTSMVSGSASYWFSIPWWIHKDGMRCARSITLRSSQQKAYEYMRLNPKRSICLCKKSCIDMMEAVLPVPSIVNGSLLWREGERKSCFVSVMCKPFGVFHVKSFHIKSNHIKDMPTCMSVGLFGIKEP